MTKQEILQMTGASKTHIGQLVQRDVALLHRVDGSFRPCVVTLVANDGTIYVLPIETPMRFSREGIPQGRNSFEEASQGVLTLRAMSEEIGHGGESIPAHMYLK